MSGIAAFAARTAAPGDWNWLADAAAHLALIGPDAQELWRGERAGLAHALLRTTPDDDAHPASLDDVVRIAADARLDARDALIRELRARGCAPELGVSDTELILHAYGEWGEQCLDHIAGDFAFAIWDARRQRLFCARDHFGIAPLYYATVGDRVLVANTIDSLLLHPGVSDAHDERAIADFLMFGAGLEPDTTTFAAIRRLPPAHALIWSDGRLEIRRFWGPPEWDGFARFRSEREYAEHFGELLTLAVSDRLRAPTLGVQLSGGLDSTSIAVIAHDLLRGSGRAHTLRAHTVALDGLMPDQEGRYASLVADSLGVPMDLIDGAAYPDIDPLETPELLPPEPSPYRRTALEYEFVRCPARHARVVLSGLGGDPLLMFVPTYALDWLARGQLARVAGAVREHARLFHRLPSPFARAALRYLRERAMPPVPPADWLEPSFVARAEIIERSRLMQRTAARAIDTRSMATSPYWGWILACGDPGFTRVPVKFRYPFFDLRLVRFAMSLPPVPWLVRKTILREAMRGRLPEPVRQRPKTPLAQSPARAFAERRGTDGRLVDLVMEAPQLERYLDRERLCSRVQSIGAAEFSMDRALASSLGLAFWLRHWRRPEPPATSAGAFRRLRVVRVGETVS